MKKILIIGAGGVGSWVGWFLHDYDKNAQISDLSVTYADPDSVDLKNLKYQKYDKKDLADNKAQVMNLKYGFNYIPRKIESEKELDGYDCLVCAVDNTIFRRMFYNYVFNVNKKVYWMDLRSEGRTIAFFCKHPKQTYEDMLATLPKEEVEEGSCQLDYELSAGIIQGGNKIIAAIGSQLILNWYRDDFNPKSLIQRF